MTLTASFGHKISLHVVLFRKQRTRTYYDYIRGILRQAAAIYLQRRSEISAATHTHIKVIACGKFTRLLVILLHHRGYRGKGNNREDTSNRSYRKQPASIIAVKSLDVPPEHTHIYIQPATLILPKESRG
jgi:hypothetical protein